MTRFVLRLFVLALVGALTAPLAAQEAATETLPNRPKVPGLMRLNLRERKETAPGSKEFKMVERISQNNIIAQRPGYDVVQFALDLVQFLESFYFVLAESTLPPARKQAYDAYMRRPWKPIHKDDGKHDVKLFDRQINLSTLQR